MIQTPDPAALRSAAAAIQRGSLVIMPTETVYGLAGDALNPDAIKRIFALKGRPENNPMIVHVESIEDAFDLAVDVPPQADALMNAFWPGPLTLVLRKARDVPKETTGGLDTIALRMPAHPVALALLTECGTPIAAPSANRFTKVSPTLPTHIDPLIEAGVVMVLDGGPCRIGLESTVLDLSGESPRILRPGAVGPEALQPFLNQELATPDQGGPRRSPGMYPRHYAPSTPLRWVAKLSPSEPGFGFASSQNPFQRQMSRDPVEYARELYATIHDLDHLGLPALSVEKLPSGPEWDSVRDRLNRAMGGPTT